jgi:hypothetical protein
MGEPYNPAKQGCKACLCILGTQPSRREARWHIILACRVFQAPKTKPPSCEPAADMRWLAALNGGSPCRVLLPGKAFSLRHAETEIRQFVMTITVAARALRHSGRTSDWMVRAGLNGEDHEQDHHAQLRSEPRSARARA